MDETRWPRQNAMGQKRRRGCEARNLHQARLLRRPPQKLRHALPRTVSPKPRPTRWDELPERSLLGVFPGKLRGLLWRCGLFWRTHITIHHLAHQRRFSGKLSVDERFSFQLA